MKKVMKAQELVNKAKDIAKNYKTLYVMGCFGAPMNATNKKRYTSNSSYNKQASRVKMINSASSDTFGFDCVCLIKGILWGWNGDKSKTYGGAVYKSNGVADVNADVICSSSYSDDISKDFSKIQIGELLYVKGHVGIYIGDGLAVECTPSWENKVQITAVGNIGKKSGYNTRTWTYHCKLKYIDYSLDKTIEEVAQEVLDGLWGVGKERKTKLTQAGYDYNKVQSKVNEILREQKEEKPVEPPKEDKPIEPILSPVDEQTYDNGINIPDNTKNVVESEKTIKYGIFVKLFIEILKLIQKNFKKGDDK